MIRSRSNETTKNIATIVVYVLSEVCKNKKKLPYLIHQFTYLRNILKIVLLRLIRVLDRSILSLNSLNYVMTVHLRQTILIKLIYIAVLTEPSSDSTPPAKPFGRNPTGFR